ncbi:MAG: insulinase family protein [Spirochaetia bacterium]|nr:insulinase family protein [Spirochaetia bacterium]
MPHTTVTYRRILSIAFLTCFAGAASLTAQEKPQEILGSTLGGLKRDIKKITLPNGLRILMVQRPFSPTVAAYIKYKAGGADETDESAGIAHMLEHMLFKGTPTVGTLDYERERKYIEQSNAWAARLDAARRKLERLQKSKADPGSIGATEQEIKLYRKRLFSLQQASRKYIIADEDSAIYALSGERGYNAYTTKDLTNYQIELPANRLEVWARLESDRMQNSVLRDFYVEREVVREERRLRVDNVAQGFLLESFINKIYESHPYGRSLIGSMEVIQYLSYEQAKQFYDTYYAPNNTVITLVGDIDFVKTEALMKKYFSDLKPKTLPARLDIERDSLPIDIEVKKDGSPVMFLAWLKPSGIGRESLDLELFSSILAGRSDSRLFRRLVLKDRVAAEVGAFTGYPGERYTNLFTIQAVPAPGKTYDDIQKSLQDELKLILDKGITQDELDRVRNSQIADFLYGLRSNAEYADSLSYYELLFDDYGALFQKIADLQSITPAEIQATARKYITPDRMSSARLVPEKQK